MSRMYKIIDVDIEIEFDDVMRYIVDHASDRERAIIQKEVEIIDDSLDTGIEGSYIKEEKMILLELAAKKYTLEELEQKLGTKFDLL